MCSSFLYLNLTIQLLQSNQNQTNSDFCFLRLLAYVQFFLFIYLFCTYIDILGLPELTDEGSSLLLSLLNNQMFEMKLYKGNPHCTVSSYISAWVDVTWVGVGYSPWEYSYAAM